MHKSRKKIYLFLIMSTNFIIFNANGQYCCFVNSQGAPKLIKIGDPNQKSELQKKRR